MSATPIERAEPPTSTGVRRVPLRLALTTVLGQDPIVRLSVLVFLAHAALLPFLDEAERGFLALRIAPFVQLTLVTLAGGLGLSRLRQPEERFFWSDLTFAALCWLTVASVQLAFAPGALRPAWLRPFGEVCFALHFTGVLMATEGEPHRDRRWRSGRLERRLAWPAVAVFLLGLYTYFALVPLFGARREYDTFVATLFLYTVVDAYVAARIGFLARVARSHRFRVTYGFLALAFLGTMVRDALGVVEAVRGVDFADAGAWSLAWYLPFFAWILAARLRTQPLGLPGERRTAEAPERDLFGPSGRTMLAALVLPFVHLSATATGVLLPAHQRMRELVVGGALLGLGAVAWAQQRISERRVRALLAEHAERVTALRFSEQDLRVMVTRRYADAALRASQDRFAKIFHANPDAIAIARLSDGILVELNESFADLVGRRRDELVGADLGRWAEWDEVLRQVAKNATVRNLEIGFRDERGEVRSLVLAAEAIVFDGVSCALLTAHDLRETT